MGLRPHLAVGTAIPAFPAWASRQPTPPPPRSASTAGAARVRLPVCRAVAAPPPAQAPPERETGLPGPSDPTAASSAAVGAHPIHSDWLAYSQQVSQLPLSPQEAVVEHLRRLLGRGDRWAWEEDDYLEDEEEEEESDEQPLEAAEELDASASPAADQQQAGERLTAALVVPSSLGAGRRARSQRRCRGRALAGAVERGGAAWNAAGNVLPAELQACGSGGLLTGEQEAALGELVQAAKRAESLLQQQQGQGQASLLAAAPAPKRGLSSAARQQQWQQQQQQPAEASLELVLRRGAAAQQLLFSSNLRLVSLVRGRVQCGAQLPVSLLQDLTNAGRDALWNAAAGYQPAMHTRFSTYAGAAILNAMRDVLAGQACQLVHVSRHGRALAKQVQRAMASMRHTVQHPQAAEQRPSPQQQARRRRRQGQVQQRADDQLSRLAAVANLAPREVQSGLAASRRQRLAGPNCKVPAECAAGASWRNAHRQLSPFGDMHEESDDEELAEAAAREAVQHLLSRLEPDACALALRMRHGLVVDMQDSSSGDDGRAFDAAWQTQDFVLIGKQLGVSRQRAQQLYQAAIARARAAAATAGLA